MLGHVQGQARHHRPARREPDPHPGSRRYGVDRSWVYRLKPRYDAEGEAAFEPRSRRPHTSPNATPAETFQLVLALRKDGPYPHKVEVRGM